jgi:hypothetical protein
VLGTYLHGPLLARNTVLADLLLGWAISPSAPWSLDPLDDSEELALRNERLEAAEASAPNRLFARLVGHRH